MKLLYNQFITESKAKKFYQLKKKINHWAWRGLLKVCVHQVAQELPGIPSWCTAEVLKQILWLLSRTCSSVDRDKSRTGEPAQEQSWVTSGVDGISSCFSLRLPLNLSIQILPEKGKLSVHTTWAALLTIQITWKTSVFLNGILPLYLFQKLRVRLNNLAFLVA